MHLVVAGEEAGDFRVEPFELFRAGALLFKERPEILLQRRRADGFGMLRRLAAAEAALDLDAERTGEARLDVGVGDIDGLRRAQVVQRDVDERALHTEGSGGRFKLSENVRFQRRIGLDAVAGAQEDGAEIDVERIVQRDDGVALFVAGIGAARALGRSRVVDVFVLSDGTEAVPVPQGDVVHFFEKRLLGFRVDPLAVLLHHVVRAHGAVQHQDIAPAVGQIPFARFDGVEVGVLVVDVGDAVENGVVEIDALVALLEDRVDVVEGPQCGEDGRRGFRARGRVVARDDDGLYLRDAEPFELRKGETDGPVGGVGSVEEVAGVDDVVRALGEDGVDDLRERVVEIGLAPVDTLIIDDVEIAESKVGVGEMDDSHSWP